MKFYLNTKQGFALKIYGVSAAASMPFVGLNRSFIVPFVGHKVPSTQKRRFEGGFTLIELMITLIVAGILLGIGVPSFNSFVKNNRIVSQSNELLADLTFARSEALKRSRDVHICKTALPNWAFCPTAAAHCTCVMIGAVAPDER
jgi:prepilin-type N-terminal cleavage/methylation domain-containing protein